MQREERGDAAKPNEAVKSMSLIAGPFSREIERTGSINRAGDRAEGNYRLPRALVTFSLGTWSDEKFQRFAQVPEGLDSQESGLHSFAKV
jgi:hypothetical protein